MKTKIWNYHLHLICILLTLLCVNVFGQKSTETVTDIVGNVYHTVKIGKQVWMVENLKTTKFNDGRSIPNVTNGNEWINIKTPGYCWYNNDVANKKTYGALYNWYTVNAGKLAPEGWHVPSDAEIITLTDFYRENLVAGGKLKESGSAHWISPNKGATNETGFTALPGGTRYNYRVKGGTADGTFTDIGERGTWWSSTDKTSSIEGTAGSFSLYNKAEWMENICELKNNGFSVRCIKD